MQINERLLEVRTKAGDSQRDTAKILNIPQPQYQRYEAGKNEISIKYLIAFCRTYNVSADYILGLSDVPKMQGEQIAPGHTQEETEHITEGDKQEVNHE